MTIKRLIIKCGKCIANHDMILDQVAEETGIPRSTVYWYIMCKLPYMDYELYDRCRERIEEHKHRGGRR